MNDDKNCDCDGFANAIWGPIALVALIVHPFLSIAVLILWAVATAWAARPDRAAQPWALLSLAQRLEQAYRATGREPPPAGARDLASERRQVLKVIMWTVIGGVGYFAFMLAINAAGGIPHPAP
jgi:hypothetical protein